MAPQWAREPVTTMITNWIQGGSWDNLSPMSEPAPKEQNQFI